MTDVEASVAVAQSSGLSYSTSYSATVPGEIAVADVTMAVATVIPFSVEAHAAPLSFWFFCSPAAVTETDFSL